MDVNTSDILSLMESDDRFKHKIEVLKATIGSKLDMLGSNNTTIDGVPSDEQEVRNDIENMSDNSDLTLKYLKTLTGIEKAKNQKNKFFDDMGDKDKSKDTSNDTMSKIKEITGMNGSKNTITSKLMAALAIIGVLHEFGASFPNIGRVLAKGVKFHVKIGQFFMRITNFIKDMGKLKLSKILKNVKFTDLGKPFIKLGKMLKDVKNFKISSIFKAIKFGKQGGRLATKSNPITAIIGEIIFTVMDGISGFFNADKWGVSKINGIMSSILATSDSGVMGAFGNFGKWALIGAGIGSVVPVLGTAIGGLIGGVLGAVIGFVGGERIAKGFKAFSGKLTDKFTTIFFDDDASLLDKIMAVVALINPITIIGELISETEWFTNLSNTIKTKFTEVKDEIITRITKVFDDIKASVASIIPKKPKWVQKLQKRFGKNDEVPSATDQPPNNQVNPEVLISLGADQKETNRQNDILIKQNEALRLAIVEMTTTLSGDLKLLPSGIADNIPEFNGDTYNTVNAQSTINQTSTNIPDYRNIHLNR